MHGYAIAERIEQLSENVLQVGEGSLYPALHRMDEAGWIRSEWVPSDNNRRARCVEVGLMRFFGWLASSLQDLRHGIVLLHRDGGISALIVLVLALGIGGKAAIFSGPPDRWTRA